MGRCDLKTLTEVENFIGMLPKMQVHIADLVSLVRAQATEIEELVNVCRGYEELLEDDHK